MACSWKAALRSWLGVLVALAITVVISVLIRTFNLFCSDPLDDLCSQRHATLTVTVLMACLWVVGKPHCAVVAMFPVILLPMMGVGGKKYALDNQYFNHVNFILLGSFLLAFAIEEVGLHHRLALKLLSMVPGDPKLVLLAMMCISALLSAFMSNTATASLMCPLATSLYEEIKGVPPEEDSEEDVESTSEGSGGVVNVAKLGEEEHLKQLFKKIMLGVAYSCSIGGISTKTGTGTNLAFMGIYSNLTGQTISYGRWILVGLPISVLMILAAWMELTLVGGLGRKGYRFPTETLKARYEKLGKTTMPEIVVEVLCVLTVLGWFFRAPAWGPGLSDLFPDPKAFTDATVVLLCTLPLFFIPRTKVTDCGDAFDAPILQWSKIQSKMPMGLFLLIGAGFAISRAFDVSGLSVEIGLELSVPTAIWRFLLTSDLALAVEVRECQRRRALTKSSKPHLAGGEDSSRALVVSFLPDGVRPDGCMLVSNHQRRGRGEHLATHYVWCGQVHGDRPTAFNASSGPRLLLAIHPGGEYAAQRDRLSNWAHHPEGSLGLRTATDHTWNAHPVRRLLLDRLSGLGRPSVTARSVSGGCVGGCVRRWWSRVVSGANTVLVELLTSDCLNWMGQEGGNCGGFV
ncbi:unnamed protein product [Durusdinium trenchii]|uniref:Uncharacterized protein n=1 Tax=Durusdinium trenchii TaxID=1381693 RepID=A0ABP0I811_9DINO